MATAWSGPIEDTSPVSSPFSRIRIRSSPRPRITGRLDAPSDPRVADLRETAENYVQQYRVTGDGFRVAFDDFGIRDGAWTADGISYDWQLRHGALEREWGGASRAGPGVRQLLAVRPPSDSNAPTGGPGAADGSLATLEITVTGRERLEGRPATVYLRWDAGPGRYRVVGMKH